MADMSATWEIEKGATLQAALTAWVNDLGASELEDARYQAAFTAFDKALIGTIGYMTDRRSGHPKDNTKERRLTRLWNGASQAISPLDPDLSDACMMKALGWTDPAVWETAKKMGLRIGVEDMQNARMVLNKKRQQTMSAARESSEARALRLLQAIYDRTRDASAPVFVAELAPTLGLSEGEAEGAWRYLAEKGLIKTFNIPYTARINATGTDTIENARKRPDRPMPGFGPITYNTINIHHMEGSSIQQAGAQSNLAQSDGYSAQDLADLRRALDLLTQNLDVLNLDDTAKRKAFTQIATLNAQLTGEADPDSMRQIGKSLRNITEGAIGGLIASAVQPGVWKFVGDVFARWFGN
jgi:hypothetical protein